MIRSFKKWLFGRTLEEYERDNEMPWPSPIREKAENHLRKCEAVSCTYEELELLFNEYGRSDDSTPTHVFLGPIKYASLVKNMWDRSLRIMSPVLHNKGIHIASISFGSHIVIVRVIHDPALPEDFVVMGGEDAYLTYLADLVFLGDNK